MKIQYVALATEIREMIKSLKNSLHNEAKR